MDLVFIATAAELAARAHADRGDVLSWLRGYSDTDLGEHLDGPAWNAFMDDLVRRYAQRRRVLADRLDLGMLAPDGLPHTWGVERFPPSQVPANAEPFVERPEMARAASELFGRDIAPATWPASVARLKPGDVCYLLQADPQADEATLEADGKSNSQVNSARLRVYQVELAPAMLPAINPERFPRPPAQVLCDGFSLDYMAPGDLTGAYRIEECRAGDVPSDITCHVRHPALARAAQDLLGRPVSVAPARAALRLVPGDVVFALQYAGPALAQRAPRLPKGSALRLVRVQTLPLIELG